MQQISVRAYAEKLTRWIPLPYWLSIILVWEGVFLVDYLLGLSIPAAHDHILEYGCLVLFFGLVSVTTAYCSKVLIRLYTDIQLFIDHPADALFRWYEKILNRSYQGFLPLVFALVFTGFVYLSVGETILQFTPAGTGLYVLRFAYVHIGFFFLGLGIWALINVMFLSLGLSRYKIRVSMNQVTGRGLQALGSAFLKMSLAIIFTFIPVVIAALASPLSDNLFILVWLGIGTVAVFGFFIVPQIGIHNIMVYEKQQRLLSFAAHLDGAMERALQQPSPENLQHLKELFELQAHLKGLNEWPFNVNTLWQLITALLIPITLALIEIFFNR